MTTIDKLQNVLGRNYSTTGSAITWEPTFRKVINKIKPSTILEIGVWRGYVTSLLSELCQNVTALDIQDHGGVALWDKLEIDNIERIMCVDNNDKKNKLEKRHFDFVFIDGDHSYAGVEFDYSITKETCDYIFFHDYNDKYPVFKFINDTLTGTGNCWQILGNDTNVSVFALVVINDTMDLIGSGWLDDNFKRI